MTYATLLVHLDVDHPNETRLTIAGEPLSSSMPG